MNNINGKLRLQFYNLIDDLQIHSQIWSQFYWKLDEQLNSQIRLPISRQLISTYMKNTI
jgi:hypothetical protein